MGFAFRRVPWMRSVFRGRTRPSRHHHFLCFIRTTSVMCGHEPSQAASDHFRGPFGKCLDRRLPSIFRSHPQFHRSAPRARLSGEHICSAGRHPLCQQSGFGRHRALAASSGATGVRAGSQQELVAESFMNAARSKPCQRTACRLANCLASYRDDPLL
jgi:hypothetical protein